MTMAWPQVEALAAAFPDRVRFFGVIRGGTILAGAICLRVTASYLYVFYWGERPEFRKESPVTLLADGLVAYAHSRGVSVLDIGVSTEHSAPNVGLIAFKESSGVPGEQPANLHPRRRLTPQSGGRLARVRGPECLPLFLLVTCLDQWKRDLSPGSRPSGTLCHPPTSGAAPPPACEPRRPWPA